MVTALRVLVTRPSPDGEKLCELINAAGDEALFFPTIDFADPIDRDGYLTALDLLAEQAWLIFISPHAVYACVPDLRRRWPHLPPEVKFAAVGAGTAQALHAAGYQGVVRPETEWNSEGLLDLPMFKAVENVRIAVIRGEGGREYIDRSLVERGAKVLPVLAYRRILPNPDVQPLIAEIKNRPLDVIICTSGESGSNLKMLLGKSGWPFIQDVNVIVMSNRVKLLLENLGFQRIHITANASHDAILDIIARIKESV